MAGAAKSKRKALGDNILGPPPEAPIEKPPERTKVDPEAKRDFVKGRGVKKGGRADRLERQVLVYLPVDLKRALKIRAVEDGLKLSEAVEEAVRAWLKR